MTGSDCMVRIIPKTTAPRRLHPYPPLSRIFGTTCHDSPRSPSNRWRKSLFGHRRKRRGLFWDAPEAPRVSPKPYARSRATRPPTINRPASAIPLTETCAASETQRVARLRAASCATPASLPLRARHGRSRPLQGANAATAGLQHWGSGGEGRGAQSFSGPTWLATRQFTSQGRCGSESQRSYSPRGAMSGVARKSSERAAPRAAASGNGSACLRPVRESGIRVLSRIFPSASPTEQWPTGPLSVASTDMLYYMPSSVFRQSGMPFH